MSSPSDYFVGVAIGEGSFGRVVHARHKGTGRDVAVKVVDMASVKKHPDLMHEIWTERNLLSQWHSNLVVRLWASFYDSQCLYLVMECVMGGDLTHLIQQGLQAKKQWQWHLSIPHYVLQLVSALEFVHSQRYVHADLKPDNVLVSNRGRIKLADFGCAFSLAENCNGRVRGTADYASPELIRANKELTVAVDLWSLGCIAYAMWSCQSPFHSKSDALCIDAIMNYVSSQDASFLKSDDIPQDWQEMIGKLLLPNPAERVAFAGVPAGQECIVYSSIRNSTLLTNVDLAQDPAFMASGEPKWVAQSKTVRSMRDGAHGWSAFVL